jgi:hypothetical protein
MEDFFMKRAVFLRWLILVTIISCGVISACLMGLHFELYEADSTNISWLIIVSFVILSAKVGLDSYRLSSVVEDDGLFPVDDATEAKIAVIQTDTTIGMFASSTFMGVGFLGTLLGIIGMLEGFELVKPSDFQSMISLMKALGSGFGVALYTTAVGLICAILMRIQCFNTRYEIMRFRDKQKHDGE